MTMSRTQQAWSGGAVLTASRPDRQRAATAFGAERAAAADAERSATGSGRDPIGSQKAVDAYLEIENAEVAYGATKALHSLSLRIGRGEFFCLLGPSGCGKSTTLNVVAGFLRVTSGKVLLAGQDVTRLPPQRRQVGIVFQSYALFPHMSVAENIGYGLKLRKRSRSEIEARVAELVRLVKLDGKAERHPRQLSGGEQQRVAIARALAISPQLLLLDEPLSNLDARLREEMRNELKRIQRATGVTTVFVTHDQEEAFGAGDRVAVMNQGRLEQVGTPAEIYRSPRTHFVASFIGRSNRLAGALEVDGGQAALRVADRVFLVSAPSGTRSGRHVLFLRPEEVQMSGTPQQRNSVPGTVSEVVYTGALVNYVVDTEIGQFQVCRLGDQGGRFAIGERVHLGWPPEAGSLLADA
jgi:putative spermidine/putrescine transport system ATP-binding protein